MGFTFRSGEVGDIDGIVELVESSYRGDSSRAGWTTEADLLDGQRVDAQAVTEIIDSTHSRVLLCIDSDEIVGCCQLELEESKPAYLGMFAVRPDLQGKGIGKAIVREAERIAADENRTQMKMTVIRQREDLIAWYNRLGFEHNGKTEPFPYGNERFGLPKRDDLEFVVLVKAL